MIEVSSQILIVFKQHLILIPVSIQDQLSYRINHEDWRYSVLCIILFTILFSELVIHCPMYSIRLYLIRMSHFANMPYPIFLLTNNLSNACVCSVNSSLHFSSIMLREVLGTCTYSILLDLYILLFYYVLLVF